MNYVLLSNTALALFTAFMLGGLIGLERQWRQRTAGLRTDVLLAVGAAAFADLGMRLGAASGAIRVIPYIVMPAVLTIWRGTLTVFPSRKFNIE